MRKQYYVVHTEEELKQLKQEINNYQFYLHLQCLINNHKDIEEVRKKVIE